MLGAIIGDKAGSNYEMEEINYWKEYKKMKGGQPKMIRLNDFYSFSFKIQTPLKSVPASRSLFFFI